MGYGAGISLFSPVASGYQLLKLNNKPVVTRTVLQASAKIFPQQCLLKCAQMNCAAPVKEYFNPWVAFSVVGVLQGGVYGQSTIHFSKEWGLGKKASLKGMFRGAVFAGARDTLSQGIPFMMSTPFRKAVLDPIFPDGVGAYATTRAFAKQWAAVLLTSVGATYMSQGMHNCQIKMQSDQTLSYAKTLKVLLAQNGISTLWRGAEARVGLLLVVNLLNELLLKPAWEGKEVKEGEQL